MRRSNKYSHILKFIILVFLYIILSPIFTKTTSAFKIDPKYETIQSENDIVFFNNCYNGESKETCTSVSGDQVTWIGDSYSDGFESEISAKLSGVDFGPDNYYTRYSKHMKWDGSDTTGREGGLTLIKKAKSENKLRKYIVFALGTNIETETATKDGAAKVIQEIINAAGSDRYIVFVTAFTNNAANASYAGLNDAMRETASNNDHVFVADWANTAKDHASEYYGGDGTHPNDAGRAVWIDTIISSIASDCGSTGLKALQDKVLELAWPENTHGTEKKPEYAAVVQKYENGEAKNSDGSTYSYVGGCSGVDCGAWVSILMRESGWDPDYNYGGGPTTSQLKYLQESDKWESLNALGTSIPEDQLQPGDVAVNDGHTYAYVGEIEGFGSHIASASLCGRAPTAGGEEPGDGDYYWFRNKEANAKASTASSSSSNNGSSDNNNSNKSSTSSGTFSAENFIKSSNNKIYDGSRDIWKPEEAQKIEEFFPLYKKAADEAGIPWAFLAVIHRLETVQSRTNPNNGQGLFQDYYQTRPDLYSPGVTVDDNNFVEQAKIAATALKKNHPDLSPDSDDNVIKRTFFQYNGTAGVYKVQAMNLGFSEEEANNGEGSPYVMNYADDKRNPEKNPGGWGQIKTDGGPISYPANTSFFGAFIMYGALVGFSPNPSGASDAECCSNPTTTKTDTGSFTKYTDMVDDQLFDLLDVAVRENSSSLNALKTELSLMANLFERNGGDRPKDSSGFCDYIKNGDWFNPKNAALIGDGTHDDHPSEYIEAARDIFINGNRTLPVEINEHDWVGDLISVTNDGKEIDKNDPSQYKRGITIIKNIYDSTYTFWAFADDEAKTGDPFGYTGDPPSEIPTEPTNNTATGNTAVDCCDGDSSETSAAAEAIAKNAVKMSWPIQEGGEKGKCYNTSNTLIDYVMNDDSSTGCAANPREGYKNVIDHASEYGVTIFDNGQDCGSFVWSVLAETFSKEHGKIPNPNCGDDLINYFLSNGWVEIENKHDTSNLQPGDVLQTDGACGGGHRMIYVGKYGGEWGDAAHASAKQRVGEIGSVSFHSSYAGKDFRIFRYTGSEGSSSSSNNNCPDDSTPTGVKALQDKAKELAWEDGRITLDRKPAYADVVSRSRFSGACGGADCGGWVTILMIESGWDPDYNPNNSNTGGQLEYVQNSDKWQEVYPPGSATLEGDLQPGDVFVKSGHTFAYVGDIEGTAGPFVEASMCQWAPTFTSRPALSSEMGVYRKVK